MDDSGVYVIINLICPITELASHTEATTNALTLSLTFASPPKSQVALSPKLFSSLR